VHCSVLQDILEAYPDQFRVDYALSREQTNAKGGKMYIQDKVEEYKDQVSVLAWWVLGRERGRKKGEEKSSASSQESIQVNGLSAPLERGLNDRSVVLYS
jgi:hypothetical protein